MKSKLYDFLKEHDCSMTVSADKASVYVFVPLYLLSDFINSCENEEYVCRFDDPVPYNEVGLFRDCLFIELVEIVSELEEDIEKYKKLAYEQGSG